MNPFETQTEDLESYYLNWQKCYPKPYDKKATSPFTKTRVILMNGTEFESNWFLHRFSQNCTDSELKRKLACVRAQEQQQQKRISCLKPLNENMLESTISYEQLAIELTAILAQNVKDKNVKNALDFALLEDFDHLYRFSNLLKIDFGIDADTIVGKYTEIMPARPTISHHRHPVDNVRINSDFKTADLYTKLVAGIITAAEQQTMNFYMNMACMYKNHAGRRLYSEIGMVEEEHVTQYESLKDPSCTWLEQWVMHEFTEAYLYYSMEKDESDENIKRIWAEHYEMECAHLKTAAEALEKYEGKKAEAVLGELQFPKSLCFSSNVEYIRQVLKTADYTSVFADYVKVADLMGDERFFDYNEMINAPEKNVASHVAIENAIRKLGKDYRAEKSKSPLKELQDRKKDNLTLGRVK